MLLSLSTDLSSLAREEAKSFEVHSTLLLRRDLTKAFLLELKAIQTQFEAFKEDLLGQLNEAMGRISTVFHRKIKKNAQLTEELLRSKETQQIMKMEVIELKEMMSEFVKSYEPVKQPESPLQNRLLTDELQIIQEEASNAAFSTNPPSQRDSALQIAPIEQPVVEEELKKSERKRTKSFLDHFRKTIMESCSQKEQSHNTSSLNSYSDTWEFAEPQKINLPKKFQSPQNMTFLKNKDKAIKTQQSPSSANQSQNWFGSVQSDHPSHHQSFQKSHSTEKSQKSTSKPKIQISSKILQEITNVSHKKSKSRQIASLFTGKPSFRRFLFDLKSALEKYILWEGCSEEEVKLQAEGHKRKSKRHRILYRNGATYEGQMKDGLRHGKGRIELNGLQIFQGQWHYGHIQGEGYVKFMKFMSPVCHRLLQEASFCGNVLDQRLNGMGTLFLNSRQKFVARFNRGVPFGEFTYYSLHEIEFGVWPSD